MFRGYIFQYLTSDLGAIILCKYIYLLYLITYIYVYLKSVVSYHTTLLMFYFLWAVDYRRCYHVALIQSSLAEIGAGLLSSAKACIRPSRVFQGRNTKELICSSISANISPDHRWLNSLWNGCWSQGIEICVSKGGSTWASTAQFSCPLLHQVFMTELLGSHSL